MSNDARNELAERDELTNIIISNRGRYADLTADAILAAGYRKPRTITSVEELDALPVGSIVQDAFAVACQRTNKWLHHEWERIGHANPHRPYLPATVLYEAVTE